MNNKYLKYINTKLIIVIIIIVLVLIFSVFTIIKFSFKQEITEVGAIPSWIKWNENTYITTGKSVKTIGKKLGVSEDTSVGVQRDIYSIPNISSDNEIAIEQLGKTYFVAVRRK